MLLLLVALAVLTNHPYGFHRDELATIDDLVLTLFGPSLVGLRFFSSLAIMKRSSRQEHFIFG